MHPGVYILRGLIKGNFHPTEIHSTHQINSRQCEQNVGWRRKVAINLCPLTWWTRRLMAPRRRLRNGWSLLFGRRIASWFCWLVSKTKKAFRNEALADESWTHLETIASQFSHVASRTVPSPPRSQSAPAHYVLSNPQTVLWYWHWRHHRLVLCGTRWCPTYWHFPLHEWTSHSRLDQMFFV